jgi:hypothetical protein
MSLLRVYDPAECDDRGVPLDWSRCRTCAGTGRVQVPDAMAGWMRPCATCDGHGSLKALALIARLRLADDPNSMSGYRVVAGGPADKAYRASARCSGCAHPMVTDPDQRVWYPTGDGAADQRLWERYARSALRRGIEPTEKEHFAWAQRLGVATWGLSVHWSPCDEGCQHGAVVRASWRQVDVRTLGWLHDLRPEKLAVLCIRCWAERTKTTNKEGNAI